MNSTRVPVLLAILFSACAGHVSRSSTGREYELVPRPDGKDLTRGNKRVLVTTPDRWEAIKMHSRPIWLERGTDYEIDFVRKSHYGGSISVSANHRGRHNTVKVTPRNSDAAGTLDTEFKELKRIDSFDAGVNGMLDVWLLRTYNRYYLLVVIVQRDNEGRTEVDIRLSNEDRTQLIRNLDSLKEVGRSIRIIDR